jgi:hypothetical protein
MLLIQTVIFIQNVMWLGGGSVCVCVGVCERERGRYRLLQVIDMQYHIFKQFLRFSSEDPSVRL